MSPSRSRPSSSAGFVFCSWVVVFTIFESQHHHHGQRAICEAAPTAPDLQGCHLPKGLPSVDKWLECCPPGISASTPTPPLFRPTDPSSLRLRRPAHLASPAYAEKLARAYALMKALPSDDPRSFTNQANIHCAYCNSAYNQMNSSNLFQVHGNWLFCPFHRWYLYFHERILAKLLGDDDTFALPFWNYDHPNGSFIPWLFHSYNDNLTSIFRDPLHNRLDAIVPIDSCLVSDDRTPEQQLLANEFAMQRALVRDASTQDGFFGLPLRQGDEPAANSGSLEILPHDTVHVWMGNKSAPGLKDMGSFYGAARDPVFYAHHAQLDRLWELWKTLPEHEDIMDDDDYLDSEFVFYNENAELVRVRVGDSLNASLLGYGYEEVETPWMNAVPTRCSSGTAELTSNSTICVQGESIVAPCSIVLERPDLHTGKGSDVLESWTGALDWLQLKVQADPTGLGCSINLYVNLPEADSSTSAACMELVASFQSLTPSSVVSDDTYLNLTVHYSLYGRLVELDLTNQNSVVITLVPIFPENTSLPGAPLPLTFLSCSIYDYANYTASS